MRSSIGYRCHPLAGSFNLWTKILKQEFLEQADAVRLAIKKHTCVPAPPLKQFLLDDKLVLGAKIQAREKLTPITTLNLGTILSIDDIVLSLMCHDNFYLGEIWKADSNKIISYVDSENFERYWNYSDIFNNGSLESLTYKIPSDKKRLIRASFLSQLAIRWTIAHEIAHWLLGHCAISCSLGLDEYEHHLFKIRPSIKHNFLPDDERKCMELQADGLAFELMLHYAVFDDGKDPLWKTAGFENTSSDIEKIVYKTRASITASSLVVMLMERARLLAGNRSETSYPKPITRLTNIVANGIRLVSDYCGTTKVASREKLVIDGGMLAERESEFRELMHSLVFSLFDIGVIAGYLNINRSIFKDSSANMWNDLEHFGDITENLVFMNNLLQYMIGKDENTSMNREQKLSFLEYKNLHPIQEILNKKLENYSLVEI